MKSETQQISPKSANALLHFTCKVFGHKYRVVKEYTSNTKEYKCSCCKQQFTKDTVGKLTPLTPKWRQLNEVYENFYVRRMHRA